MKQKLKDHPYLTAFTFVLIAFGLQYFVTSLVGPTPPFILFFGAVALSTWFGGFWPGIAATAISASAVDFFMLEPPGTFTGREMQQLIPILLFILTASTIAGLIQLLLVSIERLEQMLETTEAKLERAEEANQMKSNFIANMSHEIRAPLSAILGYSEFLSGDKLNPEEKKTYLDRLRLNAAALTHLVTDLLDVTELSSSQFVANRKWMRLPSFVQDIYSAFEPLARAKGLTFQVQLRGSIPTYIETDREQLMQILRHVIGNSIRYSEEGLVKLTISARKTDPDRREVAFIVSDQGPGIANEAKPRLFKPFKTESPLEAKNHGGGGLGLTVARKLARGLGGDVKLAKTDRKGTTFLITLDGGPMNEMSEFFERLSDATPKDQLSPDNPHALEGTRVLVVDDSPDAALLVTRMLETVGAEVQAVNRGTEGVEKALEMQPDVVLMDIQMPEVDGNEATRRLRARGFTKPIVALSAHVMKEDRDESSRSGSDEYLMKPVSRRALLETVGRYTRRKKARARDYGELAPQPMH